MKYFSDHVEEAVRQVRQQRERDALLNGEEPEEYDQEWRNACRRFPNQDDREFQKARIEAARHRDARHLGAYFEGVKRLRSVYAPDIEIMHEEYDYNE